MERGRKVEREGKRKGMGKGEKGRREKGSPTSSKLL